MSGFGSRTPILMVACYASPHSSSPRPDRRPGRASVGAGRRQAGGQARGRQAAPKTPLLSPAQLQACVNHRERLHAQTDDALKDKATIEAEKAEIARMGTSLADELTTLDRTSEVAVNAYNAKVDQRDKLIDSYQARVAAYNTKAETVKATKESYEKQCENQRYDERDLNDIKRKK